MAIMEFSLGEGGGVLVRVCDEQGAAGMVTRGAATSTVIKKAEGTFESVMQSVRAVARSVSAQVEDFGQRPDALVVQFGVELSAQAGAIITAAGASAQLTVSLTWNRTK
ncbi:MULTISPECIES: CU044_2847 family protein [unclassified Streptomyces]|uniref:CU044_2847 family protein n=1 Tax=unclassified Streptomyces TaxID=2593676 RepID=UPI003719FC4A